MLRLFLLITLLSWSLQLIDAQSISRDSANKILLNTPAFSSFKDNYFIVGAPLNIQPDANNSNVKFQISFKQRLTDAVLPFQSYLYLTYNQKSIWRIFAYSSPFAESNYNPALGIGKVVFHKNQLRGLAAIAFEHESNGRDGELSRSWNKITANYLLPLSHHSAVHLQAWLPVGVAVENADLMQYIGYGEASFHYTSPKKWLSIDVTGRKGWAWDWRGSIEAQVNIRLSKKANQYLGIQWFKGFAETLVVYNRPIHMIRAGLMIKPPHFFAW